MAAIGTFKLDASASGEGGAARRIYYSIGPTRSYRIRNDGPAALTVRVDGLSAAIDADTVTAGESIDVSGRLVNVHIDTGVTSGTYEEVS